MKEALGMVEVRGLVAAVTIADTMAKVAQVTIVGLERAKGFGWTTVKVTGDVAAVQAACDAATAMAVTMDAFVSVKVIPRVSDDVETVFLQKCEEVTVEPEAVEETATEIVSEVLAEASEEISVVSEAKIDEVVRVEEVVLPERATEIVVPEVIKVEATHVETKIPQGVKPAVTRRKKTTSKAKVPPSTDKK